LFSLTHTADRVIDHTVWSDVIARG